MLECAGIEGLGRAFKGFDMGEGGVFTELTVLVGDKIGFNT